MIAACAACGFTSPAHPRSVTYAIGHRTAHLARFPNVDQRTRAALDRLVQIARDQEHAHVEALS